MRFSIPALDQLDCSICYNYDLILVIIIITLDNNYAHDNIIFFHHFVGHAVQAMLDDEGK